MFCIVGTPDEIDESDSMNLLSYFIENEIRIM